MKLHRWVFISPGSHCLLMIIRVGEKFACSHAVNHFPPVLLFTCSTSSECWWWWRRRWRRWRTGCKVWGYYMQPVLSNQGGLMRGISNISAVLAPLRLWTQGFFFFFEVFFFFFFNFLSYFMCCISFNYSRYFLFNDALNFVLF